MTNETQETEEQRTGRYSAHLEGYLENPLVKRVLSEDTSFVEEVEDFYDISAEERCMEAPGIVLGTYTHFDVKKENPEKTKDAPRDLIEILGEFDENPLDINKLRYDAVREDYQRWHDPSRTRPVRNFLETLGGLFLGAGGTLYGVVSLLAPKILDKEISIEGIIKSQQYLEYSKYLIENPWVAWVIIPASIMSGFYLSTRTLPAPKGTNNELQEYAKLHETAETADVFMEEHYRKHFIRNHIELSESERGK